MHAKDIIIFTPPRTGRNFLQMGFHHCTDLWIETNNSDKDLDLSKFKLVFSIARDPKESISSLATMIKEKPGISLENDIQSATNKYNDFMLQIIKNNTVIYKYLDLTNQTNKLFNDLAVRVGTTMKKKYDYDEVLEIMLNFENTNVHGYKKTFTKEKRFMDVVNKISAIDLSKSYDLYEIAMSTSVKL